MTRAQVPVWGLVSASIAPVALIGGWTVAAEMQPSTYSPVRDTISALAGHAATDRWFMTLALVVLGGCHLVTAAALVPARRAGRFILAAGGVATLGVAAFPLSLQGDSAIHGIVATIAFGCLALWPVAASRYHVGTVLNIGPSLVATVALVLLVAWFAASLGSSHVGLAERFAAGGQSIWPLVVVLSLRQIRQP